MKYLVRTGGLMRCCLKTLEDRMPLCADEPKQGEKLPCAYCTSSMVFHDGAWQWDRPKMPWDEDKECPICNGRKVIFKNIGHDGRAAQFPCECQQ